MRRTIRALITFLKAEEGTVAILFGVLLVPVVLFVGGAVDVGRTLSEKARIQNAADAAALAAAQPLEATDGEREEIAIAVFQSNMARSAFSDLRPAVTVMPNSVTVAANADVATPFLSLAVESLPASGQAMAVAVDSIEGVSPGKICLLSLDPDTDDGIHLQGGNQVLYTDCWAHANSARTTALNANGTVAKATGKGHCAVGGYEQPTDNFSPTPQGACRPVADPFATVGAYEIGMTYQPAFSKPALPETCKARNLSLKKGTFELDPGRYCGGINVQAGAKVTLKPGIYFIDNGVLNVQSGSTFSGSNVLFYLTGASARLQLIGGGVTDLSGRVLGESFAGFLVIAEADANRGGESNIQGGGVFKLNGIIYMPTQRIEVSGNGDVNAQQIDVFGLIAKDFYFRGNGRFIAQPHRGSGSVPDIMPSMPADGIRTVVLR